MTLTPPWARNHHVLALLALVATTAVWGGTFVVVKDAVERMPVLPFLFWRFLIAAAVLAVLRPRAVRGLSTEKRRHGILLGLALGSAYILQTFGLLHTSATVSGFITGMFVVFTPLLGWALLGDRVSPVIWAAVALAAVGLALLSATGVAIGLGELLTLGCALMFAAQIVGLSQWSSASDAYGLTVLQLAVVALMCLVASPAEGGITLPPDAGVWAAILFLAIVATSLAFLAQAWAQTLMSAPRAAIVLTLEPVFAGIFGVTLGGDELTTRMLAGGACIVGAMYLVELAPQVSRRAVP